MFGDIGRLLVLLGVVLVVVGLAVMFADRIPFLGRLPGDFVIRRKGLVVYFPLVTMLLVSALLTIVFNLLRRK